MTDIEIRLRRVEQLLMDLLRRLDNIESRLTRAEQALVILPPAPYQ